MNERSMYIYVHIHVSGVTLAPPPALQGFLYGGGGGYKNLNIENIPTHKTIKVKHCNRKYTGIEIWYNMHDIKNGYPHLTSTQQTMSPRHPQHT
jgi:hypothetical protein